MSVLRYEIIQMEEKQYIGYKVEVPLADPSSVDYVSLWCKVMGQFPITEDQVYIGYEDYASFTGKTFNYYALAPIESNVGFTDVEQITVPKGTYYKYQSVLDTHGAEFIQKVYINLKRKGVRHDSTFDLELLPPSFSYGNPKSILYVAVREKE